MIASQKPLSRLLAALALAGGLASGGAHAGVIYDNLGAPVSGADPVLSYGPLANSFTTDARAGSLSSVALLLRSDSSGLAGTLWLSLLADDHAAPGGLLHSLGSLAAEAVSTSGFGAYSWRFDGQPMLTPNTRYWISLGTSDPVAIEWAWSTDSSGTGVAGEYSSSQVLGVQANDLAGGYQMTVNVPEPGSLALVLGALVAAAGLKTRRR